jgi:hypothetical protein
MNKWGSRDTVLRYLDAYASELKEQIDSSKTNQTLLKSYVFETFELDHRFGDKKIDYGGLFSTKETEIGQIDEGLYHIAKANETLGFLERLSDRFTVLYSIDKAQKSDYFASNLIKQSPILDSLWISGKMFDAFWNKIKESHSPHRYIKMKFEFDGFFEQPNLGPIGERSLDDHMYQDLIFDERRVTSITLVEEAAELREKIEGVRKFFPAFYSIGLLRFPNRNGKGGHDFYRNGKVTNRSDSFLDHRKQLIDTIEDYRTVTEHLEEKVWLEFEEFHAPDASLSWKIHGSPIVFVFKKRLRQDVFTNFVNYTFKGGKEPFRIQGNPIWIDQNRVHIYGTDLHLWQNVMLDLSREQFTVILPRGTCGNTIHRLVTNVQRFLDPAVSVFIGNNRYDDIISSIITGSDNSESY